MRGCAIGLSCLYSAHVHPFRQVLVPIVISFIYQGVSISPAPINASQGSAIVGIVTPQKLFLFTDSARSTIKPELGALPELENLDTQKAWQIGHVIFAQAGLQSMSINGQKYDFTAYAHQTLGTPGPYNPARFSSGWKAEMKRAITLANSDNPENFVQLVRNGVKGVEIIVGWFDLRGMPHLDRMYIGIHVSNDRKLVMEDHDSEVLLPQSGQGNMLLGAEAADIAPELVSDHDTYRSLTTLMNKGLYTEAATLVIMYAAKRFPEVGGRVQMVSLLKASTPSAEGLEHSPGGTGQ